MKNVAIFISFYCYHHQDKLIKKIRSSKTGTESVLISVVHIDKAVTSTLLFCSYAIISLLARNGDDVDDDDYDWYCS